MVEIYRPAATNDRFLDASSEIATRIVDYAVTDDVKPDGQIDSKFGPVPLVDFAVAPQDHERRCLGFARPFKEPAMQIAGWYCSAGHEVVDRSMVACLLDRLTLVNGDAKLAEMFARAEVKRTFCGQRNPILAATPEREERIAPLQASKLTSGATRAPLSRPVIGCEIRGNILGVAVADRRAERFDHLGDLGVPARRIEERRVHLDIDQAVAGAAIAFHFVEARTRLELDRRLIGERGKCDKCGDDGKSNRTHQVLP